MKLYYSFDCAQTPNIVEVGGKAKSLIQLTNGGFNVPKGAVLTVSFFKDWLDELQDTITDKEVWTSPDRFKDLSSKLKASAGELLFSEHQKAIVYAILGDFEKHERFAVRSSSPEEDLSGASFAGGYETLLGVTRNTIFEAIKKAFISCLDERVFYYKFQNGFDTETLRIAIIIQSQIRSEASGVAFSLNPLNNCFDEAVINANGGLGESVVSGMITPDEYVTDKYKLLILNKTQGSKEEEVILDEASGTKIVEGHPDQFAISDNQVVELTELIVKVEAYYGFPVDIEWAYYKGKLYLLQSRPITTYIPLHKDMQTKPSEQPILYLDASLIKQGITTPITVLGGECISKTQMLMLKNIMGKDVVSDIKGGMATTRGGRMYMNVSTGIKFQGIKRFIGTWKMVDVSTVELLENTDLTPYIPEKLPQTMKGAMLGTLKNNMGVIKYIRRASKNPEAYKAWYQPFEDDFDAYIKRTQESSIGIAHAIDDISEKFLDLLDYMLPMTYAAELSRRKMSKM
jgi:pyruvate,water dikinase